MGIVRSCNQLVSVPAFLAVSCWLKRIGKNNRMFYFPMFFMLAATLSTLVLTFKNNVAETGRRNRAGAGGRPAMCADRAHCVLAVIMAIDGIRTLFGKSVKTA